MRRALVPALMLAFALWPRAAATQEGPGITVERLRASQAPEVAYGNRTITIVRIDPTRYALKLLLSMRDGARRPLPQWIADEHLVGGINLGMFLPNGRPCGFAMEDDVVVSSRNPRQFNAFIGYSPRGRTAAIGIGGAGCEDDLAALRADYHSVFQGVRMLVDCRGRAQTTWRTNRYSAAALGKDSDGKIVMVHSRTPYRMQVLSQMLAAPELGIRGLVYMEGGPEASLVVEAPDVHVSEMGSYEDGFYLDDSNHTFWDLPNVVGIVER